VAEGAPIPEKPSMPRDVILVGKKPVMSYAMAALMQLTETGEITIKARGRAISSAVDVAEVVSKRFLSGTAAIKTVNIGTEVLGEPPRNVSTIEIKISTKPKK
jgi:DNA-binding protein